MIRQRFLDFNFRLFLLTLFNFFFLLLCLLLYRFFIFRRFRFLVVLRIIIFPPLQLGQLKQSEGRIFQLLLS